MKNIKINYFYNLLYQILTLITPIITAPYLSRVLGVEGIGISSYTLSLVSYFILFGNIGVSSYGQREIAMNRNNKEKYSKIFWELFFLRFITTFISIIAYVFLIINTSKFSIILIILIVNILASIFDISWFYQGLEEYKFISIRNIIIKLIFTLLIFIFVKNSNDLIIYICLNSLSLMISSISLWLKLPQLLTKVKKSSIKIFSHLKQTLIYFLPQIAIQVYTVLDKTMLGIITGAEIENGYYEQAHKIITMSLTVIISLNTVMSPRMSYLYKEGKITEIKNRLLKSMRFTIFLALPMSLGLAIISNNFVDWFFGSGYDKVAILMVIFSPIILIISLSNCLEGQCLTPRGKKFQSSGVLFCGAFLNLFINLLLIPKYGSIGAVIASLLAELLITVLYFVVSKKYIKIKDVIKVSYKYFISSIAMGVIVFYFTLILPSGMISTFVEILLALLIYIGLLILIRDELVNEFLDILKNKFLKKN